ncbi:MAG: DUF4105 domain-containing protein [Sphaerochaetaceae bacterium]|nr:DUF4105 domain-containing protein [Sphaerochaetaceae bacterium]
MKQKALIPAVVISLIFLSLNLPAASMMPSYAIEDPNSSRAMLEGENLLENNVLTDSSDERYTVELSTIGRGDPLYTWFGHSGLIINDIKSGRSVMYDFGIFSFDEGFYQSFALGRLWYQAWGTSSPARFALAEDEQRDVRTITLDFPQDVTLEILEHLNRTTDKAHSTYLYHHYWENCATRIRDILDAATGGQLKEYASGMPYPLTLREIVATRTASSPFIYWTLDFLQSGMIDRPITYWEAMFLPEIMEEVILDFTYTDKNGEHRALAKESAVINEEPKDLRPGTEENSRRADTLMIFFAVCLASLIHTAYIVSQTSRFSSVKKLFSHIHSTANIIWLLTASLYSLILLFMMTVSNHDVTYGNENILIISPLVLLSLLVFIRYVIRRKDDDTRFRKINTVSTSLIVLLLVAKGIFPESLYQHNAHIMAVMAPLYLVNSTFFKHAYKTKERTISDKTW